MFILKKVITALLLPPTSLVILALFGIALGFIAKKRHSARFGIALSASSLIVLLALSSPIVAGKLLRSLEIYPAISTKDIERSEAIVVLGAGIYRNAPEYGGDTLSSFGLERVHYAAHLYRQRPLPILVTGGAPFGGTPEAEVMKQVLTNEFNTPVRWAESASNDTAENARLSAIILKQAGIKQIALISTSWHLRRAVPLFEKQGLTVLAAPTIIAHSNDADFNVTDYLPGDGLRVSRLALHEWLGILANNL